MTTRGRVLLALAASAAVIAAAVAWGVSSQGTRRASAPPPATSADPTTTTVAPTTTTTPAPVWRVVWGSAMAWGYGTVDDATVRDLATVETAGEAIRFRVSNYFGNAPLKIGAATVAPSAGGSAIVPAALHTVTFGGAPGATIAPGGLLYSDPIELPVHAGETVAISLWISGRDLVSLHPCCAGRTDSYFTRNGGGNLTASPTMAGVATPSVWNRFVDAVDALQTEGAGSIVVVGDSITEGFNTTERWTDVLQQRVDAMPATGRPAVVNEGITANALTSYVHTDALVGGGPSGVSRFSRDALSQAGVSEVMLFLGTNDLWFGATAAEVITGYQQVIAAAHADGVRIVGMMLLPRSSSKSEIWTAADQVNLETVNHWIETSGSFDAVIDTAQAVADVYNGQCSATTMYPPFDSGDHLHPNAAGQTAIADYIDPAVLGLPPLPAVPQPVAAVPTAGCAAAPRPR